MAAAPVPQEKPQLIPSLRGGEKLAYEGYVYRIKHSNAKTGTNGWACARDTKDKCPATCKTKLQDDGRPSRPGGGRAVGRRAADGREGGPDGGQTGRA